MNRTRRAAWRQALGRRLARVPRRLAIVVVAILVVLIAARVAAPYVIEWAINRELARNPDYRGRVEDVDLSLLDSEIAFDGLRLDKRKGKPTLPFLRIDRIEVDYRWDELFHGRIVADVDIARPVLNIMPAATQKKDPKKQIEKKEEGQAVSESLETLLPTKIHHLHVHGGEVRFKDTQAKPAVDLRLTRVNAYVSNLSNRPEPASRMPTTGRASALLQGSGRLRAAFRLNIFARQPTFDLDLGLRGLDVRELKDFTRAYVKADLERGRASFFTELEARGGRIHGYFKPMLHDVEVLDTGKGDKDDPWYRKAWEGALGAAEELFENQAKERSASKIPIKGRVDRPGVDIWTSVTTVVVNAFIEALFPGVDRTVGADEKKKDDDEQDRKHDDKKGDD